MEGSRERLKFSDFDCICRFCLKRDLFLKPLFYDEVEEKDDFASDDGNNETVAEMVEFCTQIKITPEDDLPKFMCSACLQQLLDSNKFRLKCRASEDILFRILAAHNSDVEEQVEPAVAFEDIKTMKMEFEMRAEELAEIEDRSAVLFGTNSKSCQIPLEEKDTNKMSDEPLSPVNDGERLKQPSKEGNHRLRQCQVCGTMTKGLRLHMLTHTGEKKHKCSFCGKSFSQKGNLQRHVNIHTDKRQHKCNICANGFTDPNSLKSHMIKHTGERKYTCDLCGKSFGYSNTLLYHKRSHLQDRRYECKSCHKFFLTSYGLKKHFRVHTGQRPHKCDRCRKRFSTSSNLAMHKKIHARTRLLKCTTCDLDFVWQNTFKEHVKLHRSKDEMDG